MRRQDKYPDTDTFHYYNANPKNRITGDCVVRAISTATGISYEEVLTGLMEIQIKTGYGATCKEGYSKYLESKGWVKHSQPRKWDNTKYTGKEFCAYLDEVYGRHNNVIAHIGGEHVVAIINSRVYDIWNSTGGCIGNYWTKSL